METDIREQLKGLSAEERLQLIQDLQKEENKKREQETKKYLESKEILITSLMMHAIDLNYTLKQFKQGAFSDMEQFYETMKEHGDVKRDGKGYFTLKSQDGRFKITFDNTTIREFDERADMAAKHMDNFLQEMIKKKDQATYELVKSLMEKNKEGSFDVRNIGKLFHIEKKFDHPEWNKAIELFREAYTESGSAKYIRFFIQNPTTGKFEALSLNFASI